MERNSAIQGARELRSTRRKSAGLILATVAFSAIVNALMLTGPLYMLQVYDRVLGSGSEATLVALSGLVIVLFLALGVLEYVRGKVMAIVGARFQDRLDRRVFEAAMRRSAVAPNDPAAIAAQRDLEAIRAFLGSPVLLALMDLPWTPFFLVAIFIFHPMLGWLSIAGGAVLVMVTVLNQVMSKAPQKEAGSAAVQSERMADQLKAESETLQALGMSGAGYDRWQTARRNALQKGIGAAGLAFGFGSLTKTFRLFLQSAMLGLGAWLVLQGELSAGAMIAGSILMGRALAPIEMAVGQWAVAQKASEAWHRLAELLTRSPPQQQPTALPRPKSLLEVEGLSVGPPGEQIALLRAVTFRLEPGQALGVIGPSGAGKSTLARALTGVWRQLGGKIRLDGAALEQYDPDVLGRHIGYTYNAAGRMESFNINGFLQASYKYDAMGRQAIRTLTSPSPVTIHSVFDSEGRRIAEYDETSGALLREYIWNGWEPVAVIEGGVAYFIRADHIGRPVFATNTSGAKVWTATYLPFGGVNTSSGALPPNRFPGQWFQSESGLHQNWMRDYDPTTGRYLQADPLGLVDGASVYGYVKQNPGRWIDPSGLAARPPYYTGPDPLGKWANVDECGEPTPVSFKSWCKEAGVLLLCLWVGEEPVRAPPPPPPSPPAASESPPRKGGGGGGGVGGGGFDPWNTDDNPWIPDDPTDLN